MEAGSSTMVTAVKLPQTYPPTTAEEKLTRKNELKARGTLLMALPNEHQLKFNTYKCEDSDGSHRETGIEGLQGEQNIEPVRRNGTVETTETKLCSSSLDSEVLEDLKKFEKAEKERDDLKHTLEKFGNSSKNLSKLLEIQVSDKFKNGVGFDSQVVDSHVFDSQENERYKTSEEYHVIPPPYTGNFMPPKYDLILAYEGEYVISESVTSIPDAATSEAKTSVSKPKSVGEPIIED
ncbi:hypothetical protein Tco_0894744 [Tanacetum coccineum]|uniref:Uncharacterized protein n=1 Tax=Tanacetum coccineum TaxID=301880 RepID=A0ABQ5CF07_9ASTR